MWRIVVCTGFVCAAVAADGARFETASIKVNRSGAVRYEMKVHAPPAPAPVTVTIENAPLRFCVQQAYSLKEYQIAGPGWIEKTRYDIAASLPPGVAHDQVGPALKAFLTERLNLVVRRETQERAVYSMTAADNGPRLRAPYTTPASPSEGPRSLRLDNSSIDKLCEDLSRYADRPVLDATGIPGAYAFELRLDAAWKVRGASMSKILEREFGLKLEPMTAPVDMLIVESAVRIPIVQ
jgi:uncharacterized protein (TIGR03435 family)